MHLEGCDEALGVKTCDAAAKAGGYAARPTFDVSRHWSEALAYARSPPTLEVVLEVLRERDLRVREPQLRRQQEPKLEEARR